MPHLPLRVAIAAAFIALPVAASAQSQLERFEALSEQMTALTYQGLAEQYPVLQGILPETDWGRPERRAGRCAVRRYEAAVGEDGVIAMLDELEAAIGTAAPADILDGSFNPGVPEGLTAAQVQQINTECGLLELQMQRLAEIGGHAGPAKPMIRAATLTAALVLFTLPATAQSAMERLEAVSVTMNGLMNDAFEAEIPALAGNMPDPAWDDTLRAAYTCMYDGYVDRAGEAAVSDMIGEMEASLETLTADQLLQGGVAVQNPEGITDEEALQIVGDCGLMEAFMTRMANSGAMGIMMQQQ